LTCIDRSLRPVVRLLRRLIGVCHTLLRGVDHVLVSRKLRGEAHTFHAL